MTSRTNSEELTTALGRAVTAVWGKLPTSVQQKLFESAVDSSRANMREELAAFLHELHPRTIHKERPARSMPEPDSLGG